MNLIHCSRDQAKEILAILNDAIANSTAIYDYKPRTPQMMEAWFDAKQRGGYPVIGIAAESGELMGFASFGTFRAWPAYKYTIEHSIYVATKFRGQGLGRRLLEEVIAAARKQQYHVLIGAIDSENALSIRLHERFNFQHAGTIRQAGYKFGRWLDLVFYQLILETPAQPIDG
jgi:phosphinothricin acetyltransferase